MTTFRAFRIHQEHGQHRASIENRRLEAPAAGEILILAQYSGVNYKDALAGTGRGRILRRFPLTGGVEVVGVVQASQDARFREGDLVLVSGFGFGVERDGGYAEYACVPADWALPVPAGLDAIEAAILGTAGFTAALALERLEQNGQDPALGSMVITGASGGVGSIAVDMFSANSYVVTAVSGKPSAHEFLTTLGATEILGRDELPGGDKPLETAVWGGAVDNVGGAVLAQLTRTLKPGGNIASIGLAGGYELHTTVMPFILRGISLLGIDSTSVSSQQRQRLWQRLGSDLKPRHLAQIVERTVTLDELPETFERILASQVQGRVVVKLAE